MPLELLKCPNCGAPLPNTTTTGVVVCQYCNRSVSGIPVSQPLPQPAAQPAPTQTAPARPAPPPAQPPAPTQTAAQAPAQPAKPPPAQPVAQAPAKPAAEGAPKPARKVSLPEKPAESAQEASRVKIRRKEDSAPAEESSPSRTRVKVRGDSTSAVAAAYQSSAGAAPRRVQLGGRDDEESDEDEFDWSEESFVALAKDHLGQRDSLFFHPNIPADKLKAGRATHKESLERDERVLVLYDNTVFGGADDGFVMTVNQLCWKNIGDEPQSLAWEDIDPESVDWDDDHIEVDGQEIQVHIGDDPAALCEAAGELIIELAEYAAEYEDEE